jgi:hypothetical protein
MDSFQTRSLGVFVNAAVVVDANVAAINVAAVAVVAAAVIFVFELL